MVSVDVEAEARRQQRLRWLRARLVRSTRRPKPEVDSVIPKSESRASHQSPLVSFGLPKAANFDHYIYNYIIVCSSQFTTTLTT